MALAICPEVREMVRQPISAHVTTARGVLAADTDYHLARIEILLDKLGTQFQNTVNPAVSLEAETLLDAMLEAATLEVHALRGDLFREMQRDVAACGAASATPKAVKRSRRNGRPARRAATAA